MKPKVLCYNLDIAYPQRRIDIIIGKEMAQRWMKRWGDVEGLELFVKGKIDGGFLHNNGNYAMVLPEKFDMHTVFHECLHAATRIWYDTGAELQVPQNDEVITYMMNYLVARIEEFYSANKK